MIYILYFALAYLIITSIVLIRNLFEFKSLVSIDSKNSSSEALVSICIPARNEEEVIEKCITSVLKQDYPSFEVLVLDDNSTDQTSSIISGIASFVSNLTHIRGNPKPDDWLGKPWACHQLSEAANGDILIFIDADVWLEKEAVSKAVHALQEKDVVTVWPQQRLGSFWENMIVPLVYFTLYTLLPAIYVEQNPKWMPSFMAERLNKKFAAACGQFIAFHKRSYQEIGGHEVVKKEVVEDVELARLIKRKELSLQMFDGIDTVYCKMYSSHKEIWNGFKKNFLAGFGNFFEFFFMWAIHTVVFIVPWITLCYAILSGANSILILSSIVIASQYLQRTILNYKYGWSFITGFLHPLSVLWFHALAVVLIVDKLSGRKAIWKGREV
ncbi:MAG: glycosyltransferase [Balneola sp.]|nr:MAG: glycosyltransferase [Balneola sp.]